MDLTEGNLSIIQSRTVCRKKIGWCYEVKMLKWRQSLPFMAPYGGNGMPLSVGKRNFVKPEHFLAKQFSI
jgi:hypothetical protein